MSEHDLDSLYKRASEQDPARPSKAVRDAILEHARRLADEAHEKPAVENQQRSHESVRTERAAPSRWSRWFARWPQLRWQIAVPLAAAALAVIVLQPQLRSTLPVTARQQAVPLEPGDYLPTPAPASAPAPEPSVRLKTPPSPLTAQEQAAPEPFPAASAPSQHSASGAPGVPHAIVVPHSITVAPLTSPAGGAANMGNSAYVASSQAVAPAARMPAAPAARSSESRAASSDLSANILANSPSSLQEVRVNPLAKSQTAAAPPAAQSQPLQQAAADGQVERVRSLLQMSGVSINDRDASGRTALMLAVLHGHEAVVRALLERGADPNIADAAGSTPLAVAREQNQASMIEALLQAGAR